MEGERELARRATNAANIAGAMLLLLPFYVMSVGPIRWLVIHDYFPSAIDKALSTFYMPLWLLRDHAQAFERMLNWYLSL